MNFEEQAAKPLLAEAGIAVPKGRLVTTPKEAAAAAAEIGPCVVKAQVPTGKRGKAGGIRLAGSPESAAAAAGAIIGMRIAGHRVERVLVEAQVPFERELYAAVLNDPASKGPLVLVSTEGGMDIEEIAAQRPEALKRALVDIAKGFDAADAKELVAGLDLGAATTAVAEVLVRLYGVYRANDAELVEINPLVVAQSGEVVALDCKFSLDDGALGKHEALAAKGAPEPTTKLEARGKELGLRYIELDGEVGLLANGAGLTMTTMDAISHYGGRPANFLEIGGEAYTKATPALELVLSNPRVKSLVVNFCGAFARCDVMTGGVVEAWESLKPKLPVFFSIHGTGEDEARALVRKRLKLEPYPTMDHAVKAAVAAAREGGR